jgi:type II secretory pathway pseudopilin PulG
MCVNRKSKIVNSSGARAFTLVEVVLAISIAIGILVVALFFHSQATNLRAQLLDESDRIATIRLVMERLTAELRAAFEQPQYGFTGDATSLRFVTAVAPALPGRPAATTPRTDLRLVSYRLGKTLEGTNEIVTGLIRAEQPLVEAPAARGTLALPVTTVPADATNALDFAATVLESTNALARGPEPLTEAIRFVRLWFWDGYEWSATWDSPQLPRGIEINLGSQLLPEDGTLADYPGDLYRRVIYLPASRALDDFSDLFDATESMDAEVLP